MHQAHDMPDTAPAGMRLSAPLAPERAGLPLFLIAVQAGFPSPADDSVEDRLDLHRHLVRNETATFFLHASGDSMEGAGIRDGDLLWWTGPWSREAEGPSSPPWAASSPSSAWPSGSDGSCSCRPISAIPSSTSRTGMTCASGAWDLCRAQTQAALTPGRGLGFPAFSLPPPDSLFLFISCPIVQQG